MHSTCEHLLLNDCFAVFLPTLVFEFGHIRPFQRGFYCDDDSIKYPYKDNTVPWWAVGLVGIAVPIITVSCFCVCATPLTSICTALYEFLLAGV